MSITLDPTERRIVGSLVEKALSVPEAYPLTLNALRLACNQKNNRDPETSYEEHHVLGALRSLMNRGWAEEHERSGGRTARYAHKADAVLGVDRVDLALLAELLLRGPQSSMELRTRAQRMAPLGSVEEVESRLHALAARPVPYAKFLGKRPGERVGRWTDLLGRPEPSSATTAPPPPPIHDAEDDAARASAAAPPAAAPPDLLARLERLEREVEALRERIERLTS